VGPKRVEEFGTVPSFAEAGFPGLDVLGWRGVVGPPNLPAGIVSKWVQAMDKTCKDKGWVETVTKLGDVPGFLGPKEFKDMVDKEYSEMKEFAKAYGIN
jgi:tripartite-type tricarboxylate transporter receptor subunit TctC